MEDRLKGQTYMSRYKQGTEYKDESVPTVDIVMLVRQFDLKTLVGQKQFAEALLSRFEIRRRS